MKIFRRISIIVIILLVCEISKAIMNKTGHAYAFRVSSILLAIQFYVVLAALLYLIMHLLLPRKWTFRRKTIYSGALVITLLVGFEFLVGYWLNNPHSIPKAFRWTMYYFYDTYDFRVVQYEKESSIFDSRLLYRLKPATSFNFRNREFNTHYATNAAGLRDDDSSLKAPGIIVLGDSYAMGWGVQQEETFAQQLEQISGLRVLNAAVSSYGTARELKLLEQLDSSALKYVIIQYCINDFIENSWYKDHQFTLPSSSRQRFSFLQEEYRLGRQYFPGKYSGLTGQAFIKKQLNDIYPLFNMPMERFSSITTTQMQASIFMELIAHSSLSNSNAKIILVVMGSRFNYPDQFLDEITKLMDDDRYKKKWGSRIIPVPTRSSLSDEDFFNLDLHIRANGHKKIAQLIYQKMKEL